MRKLLSAGFARMLRSKVFWGLEVISFALSAIFYILVIINTRNIGIDWLWMNANYYFYFFIIYSGVLIAIFAGLFLGTEYAEGTIRNKLTVGHARRDIYLSNTILSVVVGLCFGVTHMIAAVLIGIPGVGMAVVTSIAAPGWRILCCILVIGCYGAIFTFMTMSCSNKALLSVANVLLAFALIVGGMYVYGKLREPQLTERLVMQEDGSYQLERNIPNSAYVDGMTREILEWIDVILPSSVSFHIADDKEVFNPRILVGMLGFSVVTIVMGICLFKRKDIK